MTRTSSGTCSQCGAPVSGDTCKYCGTIASTPPPPQIHIHTYVDPYTGYVEPYDDYSNVQPESKVEPVDPEAASEAALAAYRAIKVEPIRIGRTTQIMLGIYFVGMVICIIFIILGGRKIF